MPTLIKTNYGGSWKKIGLVCLFLLFAPLVVLYTITALIKPDNSGPRSDINTATVYLRQESHVTSHSNVNDSSAQKVRQLIFGSIKSMMRPICYSQMPLFIEAGSHHKTGHHFSRYLVSEILNFCHIPIHLSSKFSPIREYFHHHSHWPIDFVNIDYFEQYFNGNQIVLLHFVRDPLNTIISGFNYHRQCPEQWTRCDLRSSSCRYVSRWINDKKKIIQIDHGDRRRYLSRYRRYNNGHIMHPKRKHVHQYSERTKRSRPKPKKKSKHKVLDLDHYNNYHYKSGLPPYTSYANSKKITKYSDRHNQIIKAFDGLTRQIGNNNASQLIKNNMLQKIIDYDYSLCKFYDTIYKSSPFEAIYYEMVRYMNAEFDSIYESYKLVNDYQFGYNLWMDNYTYSSYMYDIFINKLVRDILKLTFDDYTIEINDYNDDILVRNSNVFKYKHVKKQKTNDFTQLMQTLLRLDINRMNVKERKKNSHITRFENHLSTNKDALTKKDQIDGLLKFRYVNDDNVQINPCQIIKEMTLKLNLVWQYDKYC